MKIDFKNYQFIKIKSFVEKNTFLLFFDGITQNSNNFINTKQNLKNINFQCHKIFNKTSKKIIKQSVFKNAVLVIKTVTFLTKSITNRLKKKVLVNNFKPILLDLLVIKLNNKMYQSNQLKNNYFLDYKGNKYNFFEFKTANIIKSK